MAREKTKFVESLSNIYSGEEIWILGSGKSLDDFPNDFFDNKISIGLNDAIYKFPECTWWHGHHEVWREYFRDERPDMLPKCIICYPMPGPFHHGYIIDPVEFFGDMTSIPYWLYFRDNTVLKKEEFYNPIKEIVAKKRKVAFRCSASVVHIAIQIAFLMGAGKITLAGCEHKTYAGLSSHAGEGELKKKIEPWCVWGNRSLVAEATVWLSEVLVDQGVDVKRYFNSDTEFYKKGYVEVV